MIDITDLVEIGEYFTNTKLVKTHNFIMDESHFDDKLKNISTDKYPAMFIVVPSVDGDGQSVDNLLDKNNMLIYFLTSRNKLLAEKSLIDSMSTTKKIIEKFKYEICKASDDCDHPLHHIFHNWIPKYHIDPEYNYNEKDGYSISFTL